MNWDAIDSLSHGVVKLLLDAMVRGMIVLLIAAGAAQLTRNAAAASRHRMWLVAIALTLLMPLLTLMPGWRILSAREVVAEVPSDSPRSIEAEDAESMPTAEPVAVTKRATAVNPAPSKRPTAMRAIPIIALVWMAGAAVMGGRLLLSRIILARIARHAKPASANLQMQLQVAAAQIGASRRVQLLQSSDAALMPMTWGLLRPTILLPALTGEWSESRGGIVLLHELSHIRRLDYVWILLAELAAAIYWFNPLWRWAANQLRDEAEQACDEAVIEAGEDRCTYADELLAAVKAHARGTRVPALAMGMSRCSTLETRLQSILNSRVPSNSKRAIVALLAIVLIGAPLSQIRLEAQTQPAAPAAASTLPTTQASQELTVGGTLTDTDGKPIIGAKLITGWHVPNRLGENDKTVVTDAKGVWAVDADSSWLLQTIRAAEPGYVRFLLQKPDRELLISKKLQLAMVRSVSVTGYVRDEGGQPIVGALITPPLTWNSVRRGGAQDPPLIYSGANGKFTVDGLSPTNMSLYIFAEAFAPAIVVPKSPDRPVIEMLSKGGWISGIVLDLHRKPLADAKVTLTEWRYKGLHRFSRQAVSDASGHFLLDHAPTVGDFWLQASAPNIVSVRTRVSAREGPPYELQMVRGAKAHVEVVDFKTGKPIASFQYSVSEPISDSDAIHFADFIHTTIESQDAKFDVEPRTRNIYSDDQPFRVRVTADNYTPEDSPVFRVNSESYFTIRLKPAKFISGTVVNADGAPVANTEVAWVRPDRHAFVSVDGKLDTNYNDSPDSIVKTDAAGHFNELKVTSESGNVAAISPAGYAVLPSDAFAIVGKLTLQPWAGLQGKFMRVDKPVASQRLHLRSDDPASAIWAELTTQSSVDGSFAFRRAPAAAVRLSYEYNGRTQSETMDLKSGQAARNDIFRND